MDSSINNNIKGSVTVFMAFSMLMIISIMCTQVQAVAVYTGKTIAARANYTASKAVMAGYNKEIFDNYHIFVMDTGFGKNNSDMDKTKSVLEKYIKPSVAAQIPYMGKSYSLVNLTGVEYDSISHLDMKMITDSEGDEFVRQAVEYMKYKVGADFAEKYLDRFLPFRNMGNVVEVLRQQQKVVKDSEDISKDILKLMSFVDGIKVKSGEWVYDSDDRLEFEDNYAKKIVYSNDSMEDMGINNSDLFKKLDHRCFAIKNDIPKLQQKLVRYEKALKKGNKKSAKNKKKQCKEMYKAFEDSIDSGISYSDKAVKLIDEILADKKKLDKTNTEYKEYIESRREDIPDEMYESLIEDNVSESLDILDGATDIKVALERNISFLKEAKKKISFRFPALEEDIPAAIDSLEDVIDIFSKYSVKDIAFDYSGLEVKRKKIRLSASLREAMNQGVLVLLVNDEQKISKNKLNGRGLPSSGKVKADNYISISDKVASGAKGSIDKIKESIDVISETVSEGFSGITDILNNTGKNIGSKLLFTEYISENFNSYTGGDADVNPNIDNVLKYEKEYIAFGNKSDKANVKAMVNRILLVRTPCNFVSLLTDTKKNARAGLAANTIFGFIPIPLIRTIAKIAIEILWAYEESLVDTSALLKGYKIPTIKSSKDITMEFDDLLMINKELINSKSEKYKKKKSEGVLSYDAYLDMFLLLNSKKTNAYRCMDLIQENINNTCNSQLRMNNCSYSIESELVFNISLKYMPFKVNEQILGKVLENRQFNSNVSFSY